jgi:phenylalanyl-tRNA synthetase alpha chain
MRPRHPHPHRRRVGLAQRGDGGDGGALRGDQISVLDRIDELRREAEQAIAGASSTEALEDLRVRYLGRKAELPNLLRGVAELPPEERGQVGRAANEARKGLEAQVDARGADLEAAELDKRLEQDRVDITLPGAPPQPVGHHHLLTQTRREIEDVFLGLGFSVAEGPEVETVYYNFDALNHAETHPARGWTDTFYVADDVVLRTHTSPMQVRAMEQHAPPLYLIVPGRVYRRDSDATHTPQFHQIEGLAVDEGITLADLKGTLLAFARAIFGDERQIRLRPHFFPFTEPSVEVDVSCFMQHSPARRCPVCKDTGWVEILGSGMVDPNVFGYVAEHGYDPANVQGFAFGMGIERIAMLKHGVPDLRLLYDNDVRFLEQFG